MKKVAVFTGKRGGFGAMFGIMDLINSDPEMELQIIVSDMHLSEKFGSTISEVEGRYEVSAYVDLGEYGDNLIDRTKALGKCIYELSNALEKLKPDLLLLLGDRGETLAAAFCAVEMGVIVGHIQAGDISGGVDDIHRHAITKLSHLHFSQNESQKQRVINLGEIPEHVWNTGAPYIDNVINAQLKPTLEVLNKYDIPFNSEGFYIVLHHSDTYNLKESSKQVNSILKVLSTVSKSKIVIYPCSDPGHIGIIREINKYKNTNDFYMFKSIEALDFLSLLKGAKALIGNSSGGIIEAPYFNLPFVLVGGRQDGRQYGNNVIKVESDYENNIIKALSTIDSDMFAKRMEGDVNLFGDGNASRKIYGAIKNTNLDDKLFRKRIVY
jgi:UDP-hydrolysing UDP-N-acetyl-D-glucosamine 2-epimerase